MDADVLEAREIHEKLMLRHMRCVNDSEYSMGELQRLYDLRYWPQHELRFKRRASRSFIGKVRNAWLRFLANSARSDLKALQHLVAIEAKKGRRNARMESLEAEARALLAELDDLVRNDG